MEHVADLSGQTRTHTRTHLFVDDLVLLTSSDHGHQHAAEQFKAE